MSRQIAILSYDIIFDPSNGWTSGSQFEAQFADYFAAHGLEAQIVEARGGTGRRVIFITRIDPLIAPTQNNQQGQQGPQQILKTMKGNTTPPRDYKISLPPGIPLDAQVKRKQLQREQQFKKGTFLVKKGYLKR